MGDRDMFPRTPPSVVTWFKVYAGFLCLLYLVCLAIGVLFLVLPNFIEFNDPDLPAIAVYIYGAVFALLGGTFLVLCALPFFLQPRPWVWIYDMIIICLGMTSACSLPFSILLLVFWLKPETKRYFGKVD